MGPVAATIRCIRVCGPGAILGHTLIRPTRNYIPSYFSYEILPKSATPHADFVIMVCYRQTWEHVTVMTCAVTMLAADGKWAKTWV
jgi:hypothetical protein